MAFKTTAKPEFFNWTKRDFQLKETTYAPRLHIFGQQGLINDPNCIFYLNNQLHIFFQHHPAACKHGLKAMSLATIKANEPTIEYQFLVNKPEKNFESHGTYSGNALVIEESVFCFYTGNARDENNQRTSSVLIAKFDQQEQGIKQKKVLFNQHDYPDYTEHFRDPFAFEFAGSYWLLLGAQRKADLQGVILLFQFNWAQQKAILVKEINLNNSYRMIECPNIAFVDQKAILFYSPQLKPEKTESGINPDQTRYCIINDFADFIQSQQFKHHFDQEMIIDYGLEFYAPQVFLINKEPYLIAWSGIPTSLTYPESQYGWIFLLTMIKKITFKDQLVVLEEAPYLKTLYQEQNLPLVSYQKQVLQANEVLFFKDIKGLKLKLQLNETDLVIKRFDDQTYYPYDSETRIALNQTIAILETYLDHSIIEIKINGCFWYTARIYPELEYQWIKEGV